MLRFYKQLLSKLKMYQFNHLNVRLILFITGLSILGLNVIASATDNPTYEKKQLLGIIVGIIVMMIIALIDYHFILRMAWIIYAFNLILLLAVKFLVKIIKGHSDGLKLQGYRFSRLSLLKFLLFCFSPISLINTKTE